MWFITLYQASSMQNIPLLVEVFNKGKDKNIAGLL